MPLSARVFDRALDLPPLYRLVTLRESGDAFAHACAIAGSEGAGTIVWTRRFDLAEFAVVLEPEEKLAAARRVFYAGMTALADALAAHAPAQRPISFDWPDALRIDGVLVGGARLGWPDDTAEDQVPEWLVFSAMIRTAVMRAGEPGLRPLLGSLEEVGFEAVDAGEIVAGFARHLMAGLHDWTEEGFGNVEKRWLELFSVNAPTAPAPGIRLDEMGDLVVGTERKSLRQALAAPSWRDPKTGLPWL
jgi:biotin-(acetyl-CoA carboxylase) ligase